MTGKERAALTEGLSEQRELAVSQGRSVALGGYEFRFEGVQRYQGPNFQADRGEVTVFRNGAPQAVLHPEKRAYASGGQVMTEAAIEPGVTRDLYVALGEPLGTIKTRIRQGMLHQKERLQAAYEQGAIP